MLSPVDVTPETKVYRIATPKVAEVGVQNKILREYAFKLLIILFTSQIRFSFSIKLFNTQISFGQLIIL